MKRIGILIATASLAAMVGGASWAHEGDRRDRHRDRHYDRGVSMQEVMREFLVSFDRLDRNGNYKVGWRELNRGHHVRRDHRGRRIYDQNYRKRRYNTQVLNERNFRRFDLNDNGKLTRKELRRGVRRAFHRADRNNNGYLGPRELANARWYQGSYRYRDHRH